jgi:hypothetical protein
MSACFFARSRRTSGAATFTQAAPSTRSVSTPPKRWFASRSSACDRGLGRRSSVARRELNKSLSASYRSLPRFLTWRWPIAAVAQATAGGLFGGARQSVEDREIAQAIYITVAEGPPGAMRGSLENNQDLYAHQYREALSTSLGDAIRTSLPSPLQSRRFRRTTRR